MPDLTESNGTSAMDRGHINVALKLCMCMLVGIVIVIIIARHPFVLTLFFLKSLIYIGP